MSDAPGPHATVYTCRGCLGKKLASVHRTDWGDCFITVSAQYRRLCRDCQKRLHGRK